MTNIFKWITLIGKILPILEKKDVKVSDLKISDILQIATEVLPVLEESGIIK